MLPNWAFLPDSRLVEALSTVTGSCIVAAAGRRARAGAFFFFGFERASVLCRAGMRRFVYAWLSLASQREEYLERVC
jgi:hypothetical protein